MVGYINNVICNLESFLQQYGARILRGIALVHRTSSLSWLLIELRVRQRKILKMAETIIREKIVEPVDFELGTRIKERRKLLGMSQTTLADKIGVTFQQVQKYEKGTNRVGSSRLSSIANALGLTPSALFGESVDRASEETSNIIRLSSFAGSAEGLALNKAFLKIDDHKVRKAIIALVKSVASLDEEPTRSSAND
jgi:transcriptional regulator with XRE-family HTH domain